MQVQLKKAQFKAAYSQIRSGKIIEDFWGEDIPYSVLRAASEATWKGNKLSLKTRLETYKFGKVFFVGTPTTNAKSTI